MLHKILTMSTFWSMYKAEKKDIKIYSLQVCGSFTISTFWSMYKAENKDVLTVAYTIT